MTLYYKQVHRLSLEEHLQYQVDVRVVQEVVERGEDKVVREYVLVRLHKVD